MGVLKKLTDEYFGNTIREEDEIDISDLDVEIVSFTDKNGTFHRHGYRVASPLRYESKKKDNEMAKTKTLMELVKRVVEKRGNECSLNDIDVSNIRKVSFVAQNNFYVYREYRLFDSSPFDGDISGWDVSKIESMSSMFIWSKFTGKNGMFRIDEKCAVKQTQYMFYGSEFDCDISKWVVSNIVDMSLMFGYSKFNHDISEWARTINDECKIFGMFDNTPLERNNKLPQWYLDRIKK